MALKPYTGGECIIDVRQLTGYQLTELRNVLNVPCSVSLESELLTVEYIAVDHIGLKPIYSLSEELNDLPRVAWDNPTGQWVHVCTAGDLVPEDPTRVTILPNQVWASNSHGPYIVKTVGGLFNEQGEVIEMINPMTNETFGVNKSMFKELNYKCTGTYASIELAKKAVLTVPAVAIATQCDEIKELLLSKNAKYGNSALEPVRMFSKADSTKQIKVRIDDKLSRIQSSAADFDDEDVVQDLIGYLMLLRIAQKASK